VCVCMRACVTSLHVTFIREGITQLEDCDIAKLCKRLLYSANTKAFCFSLILKMLYSD
jgi:hypothetical protein